jgi:hypothetical protein
MPAGTTMNKAEYLRLIERFDRLWESATSESDQKEMKKLIALIERYESPPRARVSTQSGAANRPECGSREAGG